MKKKKKSRALENANPFDRGRSVEDIKRSIYDYVGDDYPLLGLVIELETAVVRSVSSIKIVEWLVATGYTVDSVVDAIENGDATRLVRS